MYADIYMKHATYTSGQQKGVLENDYDVDLDPLESKLVSQPEHGTLELNKDGSFIYTPDEGYHGNDSFSYTAYDGEASSNVAVVSIEVICTNTPPVAVDDAFQIDNKSILQGENLLRHENFDNNPDWTGHLNQANGNDFIYRENQQAVGGTLCLLYTSPSPRDMRRSRMPSSA